jgi:PTS system mannitol-specific IIC component
MTTTSAPLNGARVHVQRFGTFLSGMIMPNIAAFIAWGLITAFVIPTGWTPNATLAALVGPMIVYLLPLLIANQGGRMVYGTRGGVVATIATMGVIVGSTIPMFLGAMLVGPLAAWIIKQVDKIWANKIRAGFEMLVDNFSAGIVGAILALLAFLGIAPAVTWISDRLEGVVHFLVSTHLLPLASIFIEPGKILFLNNAINHGVLTPLGISEASKTGKSILFLLEANPGPGLGILLAFAVFGIGLSRASAPGAIIIQFLGGIHEIYFPYVLMKPILVLAAIGGGATGVAINVAFGSGLRAPASPGSIFAVIVQSPPGSYVGVLLSVAGAATVSFLISAIILRASRSRDLAAEAAGENLLASAIDRNQANKGRESNVGALLGQSGGTAVATSAVATDTMVRTIVFACDAGMGSSAMGATVLRNKLSKAGVTGVTVENRSIANLTDDVDLVITQSQLTDRAKQRTPNAQHVSVDNFMSSTKYDEVVDQVKSQQSQPQ